MLEFKTPQIEDKAWVDQCFKHLKTMNCDYTFGNMFVWTFLICSCFMGTFTNSRIVTDGSEEDYLLLNLMRIDAKVSVPVCQSDCLLDGCISVDRGTDLSGTYRSFSVGAVVLHLLPPDRGGGFVKTL